MDALSESLDALPVPPAGRRLALRVRTKGARAMRGGHPWLFEDSIERLSHDGAPGDVAIVFDAKGGFLAAGIFDPLSTVRVKVLAHGDRTALDFNFLEARLKSALAAREGRIPPGTDAFRAVNGESDGFPGLVADVYADAVVFKAYSAAWLPWLGACAKALRSALPSASRMVIRLSRELQRLPEDALLGFKDGMRLPDAGTWDGTGRFKECGLTFEADFVHGQKTGFFLDQRENRRLVGSMSGGRTLLNLFSYSGGFSLHAAAGGARSVWSVDADRHAVEAAQRNFALNKGNKSVASCEHKVFAEDVFDALRRISAEGRLFDIVVVDPPSFAKSAVEVPSALKSYGRLAKAALKVLRPAGTLVFASCSSRVGADALFDTVHAVADESGRPLTEIRRTSHAPDHPAKFKESSYLKCLYATA